MLYFFRCCQKVKEYIGQPPKQIVSVLRLKSVLEVTFFSFDLNSGFRAHFELLNIKKNITRTVQHYKLKILILQRIYAIYHLEAEMRFLYFYTIERNFASVTREEGAPLKYYLCHLQLRLERAQSIFEIKFKTEHSRLPIFRNVTRTSEHVAMQGENNLKNCEKDSYPTTHKCDGKVYNQMKAGDLKTIKWFILGSEGFLSSLTFQG